MRARRGLLFWGLLLIPLGAVPLLVRAGVIDAARLVDAWKLWPLLFIGIGAAILVGRTRVAIVGTAVIALTLGTIAGAAVASSGSWIGAITHCGPGGQTQHVARQGAFADSASVVLDLRCGSVDLKAAGGSQWTVDASYRDAAPSVDASSNGLTVRAANSGVNQHDDWTIGVPASQLREISLTANAGTSELDLADATLHRLHVDLNAGDTRITAPGGGTDGIDITMNAGRLRLETGSAPMAGSVSMNAGAIDLCVPHDVGLRLDVNDQLTFGTNLAAEGLAHSGTTWTREAAAGAPTIELSIEGNAAALTLKGEGACK
ncbi:MAG: hypothetical protein ACJ765_12595 [Chloroflexota bacterium]